MAARLQGWRARLHGGFGVRSGMLVLSQLTAASQNRQLTALRDKLAPIERALTAALRGGLNGQ